MTSPHVYWQPPACWGGRAGEEESLDAATSGHGSRHCDRAAGHGAVPSYAAWGEGMGGSRSRRTFLSMPRLYFCTQDHTVVYLGAAVRKGPALKQLGAGCFSQRAL